MTRDDEANMTAPDTPGPAAGFALRRPMVGRDPQEGHRAATPLELLFDLCFVVAIARAAAELHHQVAEDHVLDGVVGFGTVFFAIWWAWMNFTWFASAYDTDDVAYRVMALVQMAGALIIAAGVTRAVVDRDFGVVTLGYVVARLALVVDWLRAARDDPGRSACARRYAAGIVACQVGWLLLLLVPEGALLAGFLVMAAAELAVPVVAERGVSTTWHPHHIVERYGLFTIIVLGEAILAATVAFQSALDAGDLADVAAVAVGALVIVFALWWVYFAQPATQVLHAGDGDDFAGSSRATFAWGYGHFVVFAAVAAVGAGVQVVVDQVTHHAHVSASVAAAAVAVPVALFLAALWLLHGGAGRRPGRPGPALPAVAVLVLFTIPLGELAVPAVGALLAALVALEVARQHREAR